MPRVLGQRRFDVAPRKSRRDEGTVWIDQPGRYADLYLFADHPITDDRADHRDPAQWVFYAVATGELPDGARTLSLGRVRLLAKPHLYGELAAATERLRLSRLASNSGR